MTARRLVEDLPTDGLGKVSLIETVRREAEKFSAMTSVPASVCIDGEPKSLGGAEQRLEACRCESTGDCAHLQPYVGLGSDHRRRGRDPHEVAGVFGDRGLGVMAERVAAAAGELRIDSEPGLGTTVTATIPTSGPVTSEEE